MDNTKRRQIEIAAILMGAFLYYLSYLRYGLIPVDEGVLLDSSERMMRGEEWCVDFFVPYGALRFWFLSLVFRIFGASFVAYKVYYILFRLIGLGLMLAVASRIAPLRWSLLAVAMATVLPGHIFKSELLVLPMFLLWSLFRSWESKSYIWPGILGISTGLSFWFRPEFIVPILALALVGLEGGHVIFKTKQSEAFLRRGAFIAGLIAMLLAPATIFPGAKGVAVTYWTFAMNAVKLDLGVPWPVLPDIARGADNAARFLILWGAALVYVATAFYLLITVRRARSIEGWGQRLMILITGVAISYNAVYQANLGHALQVLAPAIILFADLGRRGAQKLNNRRLKLAAHVVFAASAGVFIAYGLFLSRDISCGCLSLRRIMDTPIQSALGTVYFRSPRAEQIQQVVDYIKSTTSPDAPVAAVPEPLLIPVLAGRRNPTSVIPIIPMYLQYVGHGEVERFHASVMEAELIIYQEIPLRLGQPRPDVQRMRFYYHLLLELILRNYTFEKRIGDYLIFRKGPDRSGATRAFFEGWDAFQYGRYDDALANFEDAMSKGGKAAEIAPLLDEVKKRLQSP